LEQYCPQKEHLVNRWSEAQANEWYQNQPWLVGCNYIPRTAINQLEMWQADTFDLPTIDQELAWASSFGMNTIRVFLHNLAWEIDPEGFKSRVDRLLSCAARHGFQTILVLFDDCWNATPEAGQQPNPIPGVHNSGWLQSPGAASVNNPATWGNLLDYVSDVIGYFNRDERILLWDLYNEPGNREQNERSLPLLCKVFEWARAVQGRQPLTAGLWCENNVLNTFQLAASDVITFHNYTTADLLVAQIADLQRHGRPLICTEWMCRGVSEVATSLPVFFNARIGCCNWGLVSGKTQTIYPWNSPPGAPEPARWFHDLLHQNGSAYDDDEIRLFKKLTAKSRTMQLPTH
jgi:hypothetical protein